MRKILLDTNFLMIPCQFRIDIFSELERVCSFRYKLFVLDATVAELKKLSLSRGKKGSCAKMALRLIEVHHIEVIKTQGCAIKHTDDLIVGIADKEWIVATQDSNLKRRLKQENVGLITLRQKRYLMLDI